MRSTIDTHRGSVGAATSIHRVKDGWPDRTYVRLKEGKLEVRLVEIKSPNDTLSPAQELMHEVLRSQGLSVQIEPASKAPKTRPLPLDQLPKALEILERNRQTRT